MRKEYRQALRELFPQTLHARLPQFVPVKESSKYLWPGEIVFMRQVSQQLRLYVIVSPDPKAQYQAFSVSVAWSKLNRFPELSMRPSPRGPFPDSSEFDRDEYEVELIDLCKPKREWWSLVKHGRDSNNVFGDEIDSTSQAISIQQARNAIGPLVEDAVNSMEIFGMPYLERFLRVAR